MKDQKAHWNNAHDKQWLRAHSAKQTAFAEEVNIAITPKSRILELGCGEGNDSIYFAQEGHSIISTDFSDVVITQNKQRYNHPLLRFEVQDISEKLPFDDNSFDVVYARLSLHYFNDVTTRDIIKEIYRVLKTDGCIQFMCKSTDDPIYGEGDEIETDMFELDGHVRHFFSPEYAKDLLESSGFSNIKITAGKEKLYDRMSAFVKGSASKVNT